jgi:hypothetical protein
MPISARESSNPKEFPMKKRDLTKLAVAGIASGLLLGCGGGGEGSDAAGTAVSEAGMSESELLSKLNPEKARLYESLSPEGKELVRKVALTKCNGQNDCKGLGGCKTGSNECKGMNECKGKGGCALSPDEAVERAVKHMAQKRISTGY